MKKIDFVQVLFFMFFLYHFASLDYRHLTLIDKITSVLAVVWLILLIINIILRWRVKAYDKRN